MNDNATLQTIQALSDPSIPAIFEAAFFADNTLVRCDILKRAGSRQWEMWEVKSVGSPKDIHVIDVAIQAEIARRWAAGHPPLTPPACGGENNATPPSIEGGELRIVRCGILHLNKDYIYQGGEYDLQSLFTEYDCTDSAKDLREEIDYLIRDGYKVANLPEPPDITPGEQCDNPYPCPFLGTACAEPPVDELTLLPRMTEKKLAQLKERGISQIDQLSESDTELSVTQQRAVAAWKSGEVVIEPGLKQVLNQIGYPRMHLDFETFMAALPRYPGTRPYQTIPFQFSIHIELQSGGDSVHTGYLHNEDTDPRRPLAEAMLESLEAPQGDSLRANCPILTYSPYEKRIIGELAEALPDLRLRLLAIQGRLLDLLPIIRNNVYAREFGGGFSVKKVLPALVRGMGYDDLDIAEGGMASLKYLEMLELKRMAKEGIELTGGDAHPTEAAQKIYNDLWLYCERDTEAMVALMKQLEANL